MRYFDDKHIQTKKNSISCIPLSAAGEIFFSNFKNVQTPFKMTETHEQRSDFRSI